MLAKARQILVSSSRSPRRPTRRRPRSVSTRSSRPTPGHPAYSSLVNDAHAAPRSVGVVVVAGRFRDAIGRTCPRPSCRSPAAPSLVACRGARHAGRPPRAAGHRVPEAMALPQRWETLRLSRRARWCCPGGAERTDSVRAGLAEVGEVDIVLIHDAARAFTPVAVLRPVVAAVAAGASGAVPGLPVVDTIKAVDADGTITGTPDRAGLRAVQTLRASTPTCCARHTPRVERDRRRRPSSRRSVTTCASPAIRWPSR